MLQNEYPTGLQEIMIQYHIGELLQPAQIIWRIGKDDIVLRLAGRKIPFDIHVRCPDLVESQLLDCLYDKCKILVVIFHQVDHGTVPGSEFITDASCSREEIQNRTVSNIVPVDDDVKKAFLCQISGWPCTEILWRSNDLSPVFSADYSQG